MKFLVTGGAGFIGSHLCESLVQDGHSVVAIDDLSAGSLQNLEPLRGCSEFRFVRGSVLDQSTVEPLMRECDVVFHLAAVVGVLLVVKSPVQTLETNLKGTEVVLDLANEFGKRVLLASTSEVYGRHFENRPLKETDDRIYGPTTVGRWSYAAAKAIDEFLGLAYHRERGLHVTIARFFNTVGPRQTGRYGMVIPRFVEMALGNQPITVFGDGNQSRSFTYVSDAVWAIRRLAETPEANGEIVNVGNGSEVTIHELARMIKARTDPKSEIVFQTYEEAYGKDFEDMNFRNPDISKLHRLTGFEPKVELPEMLDRVIEHMRNPHEMPIR